MLPGDGNIPVALVKQSILDRDSHRFVPFLLSNLQKKAAGVEVRAPIQPTSRLRFSLALCVFELLKSGGTTANLSQPATSSLFPTKRRVQALDKRKPIQFRRIGWLREEKTIMFE